jgi:hypothetical protein
MAMTVGAVASVAVTTFVHARPELARQGSSVAGRVRGRLGWSRGLVLRATKERERDRRSWCSHCGGLAVRRLGFCFCSPPRLGNMCDYSVMFRGKKKQIIVYSYLCLMLLTGILPYTRILLIEWCTKLLQFAPWTCPCATQSTFEYLCYMNN